MNTRQKVVTTVIAILMLGTIFMMPREMPGRAAPVKRIGAITAPAQAPAGLPQGEAKGLQR
jgi:hypothetical protein